MATDSGDPVSAGAKPRLPVCWITKKEPPVGTVQYIGILFSRRSERMMNEITNEFARQLETIKHEVEAQFERQLDDYRIRDCLETCFPHRGGEVARR
jgi:hypothetical protein